MMSANNHFAQIVPRRILALIVSGAALCISGSCDGEGSEGETAAEERSAPHILLSAQTSVSRGDRLVPLYLERPSRDAISLSQRIAAMSVFLLPSPIPERSLANWSEEVVGDQYRTHVKDFDSVATGLVVEYQPHTDRLVLSVPPQMLLTRSTGIGERSARAMAEAAVADLGNMGLIEGRSYGVVRSAQMLTSAEGLSPHVQEYVYHFQRFEHGFALRNSTVEVHVSAADGRLTRLGIAQVLVTEELRPETAEIDSTEAVARAEAQIRDLLRSIDPRLRFALSDPLPAYQLPLLITSGAVRPETHIRWTPFHDGGAIGRSMLGVIGFRGSAQLAVTSPPDKPLLCEAFAPGRAVASSITRQVTHVTVDESYAMALFTAHPDQVGQCERVRLLEGAGGWEVAGLRPGDIATQFGLENGDARLQLCDWTNQLLGDCFPLDGPASLPAAIASLSGKREFRLTLTRASSPHTIYYTITQCPREAGEPLCG